MDMKEWIQNMHYHFIKINISNKQSLTVSKYLAKQRKIQKGNSLNDNFCSLIQSLKSSTGIHKWIYVTGQWIILHGWALPL